MMTISPLAHRLCLGGDPDERRGNVIRGVIRYRGSGRCVEATPALSASHQVVVPSLPSMSDNENPGR